MIAKVIEIDDKGRITIITDNCKINHSIPEWNYLKGVERKNIVERLFKEPDNLVKFTL